MTRSRRSSSSVSVSAIATLIALIATSAGTSHAETQAELAAKENEEGKELMYRDQFAEAAKKFAQASARVPEAKYFLNLCTARLNEGQLSLALTACNAAELNSPSPDQKDRAEKLITRINEEGNKKNIKVEPVGGGGGNQNTATPEGSAPPPPPTVVQPLQNLVVAGPPEHRYTWTLGFDIFGGGGQVGQPDIYGTTFGGIRIKGDYLLDPVRRIGGEVYAQISHLGPGSDDLFPTDNLDIFDFGVAVYKHFCPGGTPRLCFTPLAGAHLSFMSPADQMDETGSQVFNYAAVGGRLEASLDLAFGPRYQHVLSVMIGANIYSPVLSGPSQGDFNLTAAEQGLDRGGATGYLGLGYTLRFNSPLGATPFIVLE
jgi:hypothetical protein